MQDEPTADRAHAGGAAGDTGGRVQSRAQEAAGQASEAVQGLAGQAGEKTQELAGQASAMAQQARGRAGGLIREQVEQRASWAGERVSTSAGDLRSLSEELRRQEKEGPARLAEGAAERAERLGEYLSSSDPDRLLRDLEDIGRRQPWTVALGALALGFAAARVLGASSSRRSELPRGAGGEGGHPAGMSAMQPGGYMPGEAGGR